MVEVMRNKKRLVVVSVLVVLLMACGLYVNQTNETEQKRERQLSLIGQWVSVDGFCNGKVGEIRGLDITNDFYLVEDGHKQKINNMDIIPESDIVGYCKGFGQFEFQFRVVMNTNDLVEYKYAKTEDGTELLRSGSGEYYFRFLTEFKRRYEDMVAASSKPS